MTDFRRMTELQTIFSFFLGLMVAAFLGVGVYTFHPPDEELDRRVEQLNREQRTIENRSDELSAADRQRIQEISDERDATIDSNVQVEEAWGRSTSIILIVLATLAMAVSLVRADKLPVIGNGLLLGGLFTMVYGVGWIVVTDTSLARFFVMTAALAITLGLGYIRFVYRRTASSLPEAGQRGGSAGLEQQLRDLEERMNQAADALGRSGRRKE